MVRIIRPHKPLIGSVMAGLIGNVSRPSLSKATLVRPLPNSLWTWLPFAQGYISDWPVKEWCVMPSPHAPAWLAGRMSDQRGHIHLLTDGAGRPLQFNTPEGATGAIEQLNFTIWLMEWVDRR